MCLDGCRLAPVRVPIVDTATVGKWWLATTNLSVVARVTVFEYASVHPSHFVGRVQRGQRPPQFLIEQHRGITAIASHWAAQRPKVLRVRGRSAPSQFGLRRLGGDHALAYIAGPLSYWLQWDEGHRPRIGTTDNSDPLVREASRRGDSFGYAGYVGCAYPELVDGNPRRARSRRTSCATR